MVILPASISIMAFRLFVSAASPQPCRLNRNNPAHSAPIAFRIASLLTGRPSSGHEYHRGLHLSNDFTGSDAFRCGTVRSQVESDAAVANAEGHAQVPMKGQITDIEGI